MGFKPKTNFRKDETENIIRNLEKIKNSWHRYFRQILNDNLPGSTTFMGLKENDNKDNVVSIKKIVKAIVQKGNKAPGMGGGEWLQWS